MQSLRHVVITNAVTIHPATVGAYKQLKLFVPLGACSTAAETGTALAGT